MKDRVLFVVAVGLVGCGPDSQLPADPTTNQQPEEETGQVQQRSAAFNVTLWDTQAYTVDVCFMNHAELTTARSTIQTAITNTWDNYSGLAFNWIADCPSGSADPGVMPIALHHGGTGGGGCVPGPGARQTVADCGTPAQCQCMFDDASATGDPAGNLGWTAIHEIGHGVGLPHEHQRSDRPASVTTQCAPPGIITNCCVDPNPDPNKWTGNSNYTIDTSLRLNTLYDGLDSVMSYCQDVNRDGFVDARTATFSYLDGLGIEMIYPFGFGRKPVIVGGVGNSGGSTYIVRGDTAVGLRVDWVFRGANPVASGNPGNPTDPFHAVQWQGAAGIISTALSPNLVLSTNQTIQVDLYDALLRHHPWTGVSVVVNKAKHTAILAAVNVLI